ncbi:MAG TPA: hypothetical protein VIM07_09880 [Chitinophagaceae bacterium]
MNTYKIIFLSILIILFFPFISTSQHTSTGKYKKEFYFSWGYNTEWYTHSNVKVKQPELGNKYTLKHVLGHDHRGWDESDFFSKDLTIPQYNYRIGYFFNKAKDIAFEINFDHTKFIITDGQQIRIQGAMHNRNLDSTINFSQANGFYYYLNNGANFLLFNLVKRWNWYTNKKQNIKIDALGKAGIGTVIPHVENSFFGNSNDPHFQLGGWNTGVEGALRATFYKHIYLEFAGKLDYARYSHLKIYKGDVSQAFSTAEIILNLGYTFKSRKHSKK